MPFFSTLDTLELIFSMFGFLACIIVNMVYIYKKLPASVGVEAIHSIQVDHMWQWVDIRIALFLWIFRDFAQQY